MYGAIRGKYSRFTFSFFFSDAERTLRVPPCRPLQLRLSQGVAGLHKDTSIRERRGRLSHRRAGQSAHAGAASHRRLQQRPECCQVSGLDFCARFYYV